jgi:mannosyl-3-phosphoglycerate phosphatase family protein
MTEFVIFSDIDGTFLDKRTYRPGKAIYTLLACRERNIPIVFVSAKTCTEIEALLDELDYITPFVCENGGGLFLPRDKFARPVTFDDYDNYWRFQSDITIDELHRALVRIAHSLDISIKGFLDMSDEEVAHLTGLDTEGAARARKREYDEPFIIINETEEKIQLVKSLIIMLGYGYTHGGGLHHIMGRFDKGRTLQMLKNIYLQINPKYKFIGVGDAYNDLPMLRIVDYPFLVRKPDGSHEKDVTVDNLKITDGIGPDGFTEAINSLVF